MEARTKLCQIANSSGTFAVEIGVSEEHGLIIRARSMGGKWGAWKRSAGEIKFPDNETLDEIYKKILNHSDLDLHSVLEDK